MKFPNMVFAIALTRKPHYEIARAVDMTEWCFSRKLNGRGEFSPVERERLAEVLGFNQSWLFEQVTLPARAVRMDVGTSTVALACASGADR